MNQFAILDQPQAETSREDGPRPIPDGARPLGFGESAVATIMDVLTVLGPALLAHLLLGWSVLAWIIAGEIVVMLALLLATLGRTPGLAAVSATVAVSSSGTTPAVGHALLRVLLTPLLPLGCRTPGTAGEGTATAARRSLLDSLTGTTTRTSRPNRRQQAAPPIDSPAPAADVPFHSASVGPSSETDERVTVTRRRPAPDNPAPLALEDELPRSFPPDNTAALPHDPTSDSPLDVADAHSGPVTAPPADVGSSGSPADATRAQAQPLYRIVVDSTRRMALQGQCVLGRAPRPLTADDVQLITLDASSAISRSHLRIGIAGAGPWAEDLGSANGSVLLRANGIRTPLEPGVRTPLGPGGVVVLAEGVRIAVEAIRQDRHTQAL